MFGCNMRNTFFVAVVGVSCLCGDSQAGNPPLPSVPTVPTGNGSTLTPAQAQQIMQMRALQSRGGGGSRGPQRGAAPVIINNTPGFGGASGGQAAPASTGSQKSKEKRAEAKRLKAEQKKLAKDAEKKTKNAKVAKAK
jgi:hypothetical protein